MYRTRRFKPSIALGFSLHYTSPFPSLPHRLLPVFSTDRTAPTRSVQAMSDCPLLPSDALKYFNVLGKLKTLKRTGWVNNEIPLPESVADHMYRMSMLVFAIRDPGANRDRLMKVCMVHDLAEAVVGDITPYDGVTKEEKRVLEERALESIVQDLGNVFMAEEIRSLWLEYEEGTSLEAELARQLDKFEMIVQANEYELANPDKRLDRFFESTKDCFSHPEVSSWNAQLRADRDLAFLSYYNIRSLTNVITTHQRKTLHTYQYSGGDSSPVYKHVLSPLAQFCVDSFIPMWMAPNVVTLLGLFASVVSLCCTLYFDPLLLGKGPRWLYLVTGFCVFAYQTFDNMDGKQARRTGSSSALGMLFDHGCDAINAGIMCIPMGAVVASGWSTKLYLCVFSGFVPFYFQTWEEYYIGSMVLPPFNGPTEGLLIAACMCVGSYFLGPDFWQTVIMECPELDAVLQPLLRSLHLDWTPNHGVTPFLCALAFTTITSTIIAIKQVYTVFAHVHSKGGSVLKAGVDLLPFLVFFPSLLYWGATSDIALKRVPLLMFLCIGATFVEMLVHMMIAHICHGSIEPFGRTGAFLTALLPIVSHLRLAPLLGVMDAEFLLLCLITVYSCRRTGVMFYQMCTEVADELGIHVLRLGKSRKL